MPDFVFKKEPRFGANVSNRPDTARAAGTQPAGPRGFPPPPVPPPSTITAATIVDVAGDWILSLTFSPEVRGFSPFGLTPGLWTLTANGVPVDGGFVSDPSSPIIEFGPFNGSPPWVVTVPEGQTRMFNANGGGVVPGVYPVTVV